MTITLDRRALVAGAAALVAWPVLAASQTARVERRSPALDRVVAPGTRVEVVARDISWAEGPVWVPALDSLLFSDPPANIMRRWNRTAGVGPFLSPSGAAHTDPKLIREPGSNGLALDRKGRLLIANSGGRSIDRLDVRTKRRTTLVDRYQGKRFNSCNDLTVATNAAIYFTDPPYGLAGGDSSPLKELPINGVYRWSHTDGVQLVDGSLTRPNGIALSPDERRLFVSVSDEAAPRIMVYDLDPHGMPTASRMWLDARPWLPGPGLPDGMKCAANGTMFCSAPGGMYILTPEAEPLGLVAQGMPIANCCFGEGGRTLFMAASDRILRMPLLIDGRHA